MRNRHSVFYLGLLVVIAAIIVLFRIYIHALIPHWRFESFPIHSTIVAFGAMSAIILAVFLLQKEPEEDVRRNFSAALGFIAIGLLEGFHAITMPGEGFVLLHTMANLFGGVFFALAWLPEPDREASYRKWLPWAVSASAILFGIWTLLFRETLPLMVQDGNFTVSAIAMNRFGGLLFVAGALRFLLDFYRSKNIETYLLVSLSLCLGLSGIMFKYSFIWDDEWWFWHIVSLIAYLLTLWLVVSKHRQSVANLIDAVTERKQAEDWLRLFKGAVSLPIGITICDVEGKIIYTSPAEATMHGYSVDELIGRNARILAPPELWKSLTFKELLEMEVWKRESVNIKKDGSSFYVSLTSRAFKDVDGRPIGIITTCEDITERKQAEETLRETRDYLENLFNYANAPIIVWDPSFRITQFNHAFEHLTGYKANEVIGKQLHVLFPEESRDESMSKIERTLSGEYWESVEIPILHKDGEVRIALWNSANIFAKDNKTIVATIAQGQDITERKQAEEFITKILESVGEGFIVIDPEYRIISANKAFCNEVKMPLEDIIGRHCYEVSHQIYKPCYEAGEECTVKQTFETGESHMALHTHYDKQGDAIFIEIKSYPMKDSSGGIISVIEVLNNITEKKKLEDQLHQSQKMEAIGQLSGGIAHDFNNILTAMISYASILQMKIQDAQLKHSVDQILTLTERAANLTQSLLAFGRKKTVNLQPTDINNIIKKVEKLLLRIIGEDIEFKTILKDEELIVKADTGQIEQVLMNLAGNSRDAMPKGGLLTISTALTELREEFIREQGYGRPGMYALISITDAGIGMDEKTREKIFEPFFTTKEVGKGTGLGLSIVYRIIKQHNGFIHCYSELGKGTTFKVYLPVIKKTEIKGIEPAEIAEPIGGTETILMAEDAPNIREIQKITLEGQGYKVIEAEDGEDAINKFMENKEKIDILLFDMVMPKMNGKEAYERIKKISPGIKVLFMSGYPENTIRQNEILGEDIIVIPKPLSPTMLLKNVRECLDR